MNHVLRLSGLMAVLVFLVATLAATGSAVSAKVDDDAKPARIGVTVTGIVEEDYADGLLLTTEDGEIGRAHV